MGEWNGELLAYLPRSHARLLGYINEEDHVAKSKLAKIPNINTKPVMNVQIGLNVTSVCLKQFKLTNFTFGDMHSKHDKV